MHSRSANRRTPPSVHPKPTSSQTANDHIGYQAQSSFTETSQSSSRTRHQCPVSPPNSNLPALIRSKASKPPLSQSSPSFSAPANRPSTSNHHTRHESISPPTPSLQSMHTATSPSSRKLPTVLSTSRKSLSTTSAPRVASFSPSPHPSTLDKPSTHTPPTHPESSLHHLNHQPSSPEQQLHEITASTKKGTSTTPDPAIGKINRQVEQDSGATLVGILTTKHKDRLEALKLKYQSMKFDFTSKVNVGRPHQDDTNNNNQHYTRTNFQSPNRVSSTHPTFPLTNPSTSSQLSATQHSNNNANNADDANYNHADKSQPYINPLGSSAFISRRAQATRETLQMRTPQFDPTTMSIQQQTDLARAQRNTANVPQVTPTITQATTNPDQRFQPYEQYPRSPLFSFSQYNNAVISPYALPSLSQHKALASDVIARHKAIQHEYEIITSESVIGRQHLRDVERSVFNELVALQLVFDELLEEFPHGMNTMMDMQALEIAETAPKSTDNEPAFYHTPNSRHNDDFVEDEESSASHAEPPMFEPHLLPEYHRKWSPTVFYRNDSSTTGDRAANPIPPTADSIHRQFISMIPNTSSFKPPTSVFDISSILLSLLHQNKIVTSRQQIASVYLSFLKHHYPEINGTIYGSLATGVSNANDADVDISLSGITPPSPLNTPDIIFRPMRLKSLLKQLDDSGLPMLNWDQVNVSKKRKNAFVNDVSGVESKYESYLTDFNANIDRFTLNHFNLDNEFVESEIANLFADFHTIIKSSSDTLSPPTSTNATKQEDTKISDSDDGFGFFPSSWSGEADISSTEITPVDKLYSEINSNTPAALHHLTNIIQEQLNRVHLEDVDSSLVFFDQTRSFDALFRGAMKQIGDKSTENEKKQFEEHSPDNSHNGNKDNIPDDKPTNSTSTPTSPLHFTTPSEQTTHNPTSVQATSFTSQSSPAAQSHESIQHSLYLQHLHKLTPSSKHILRRHEIFAYSLYNYRRTNANLLLPPPSTDYTLGTKFPSRFHQMEVVDNQSTPKKTKLITMFTPISPSIDAASSTHRPVAHFTPFEFPSAESATSTTPSAPSTPTHTSNSSSNTFISDASNCPDSHSIVARPKALSFLPRLTSKLRRLSPQLLSVSTQWQAETYSHQQPNQTKANQIQVKQNRRHLFSSASQITLDGVYNLSIDPLIQSPYRFYSLQSFVSLRNSIATKLDRLRASRRNSYNSKIQHHKLIGQTHNDDHNNNNNTLSHHRDNSLDSDLTSTNLTVDAKGIETSLHELELFQQDSNEILQTNTQTTNSAHYYHHHTPLLNQAQYNQYKRSPLLFESNYQSSQQRSPSTGWDLDESTNPHTITLSIPAPFYLSNSHPRDLEPSLHSFVADTQSSIMSLLSHNGFDTSPTNGDPRRMRNPIIKLALKKSTLTQQTIYDQFRLRQSRPDLSTLTKPNVIIDAKTPNSASSFIMVQDFYTSIFRNWFQTYTTLGKSQHGLKTLRQYQQRYFQMKQKSIKLGTSSASFQLNAPSSNLFLNDLQHEPSRVANPGQTKDKWGDFTTAIGSIFPTSIHNADYNTTRSKSGQILPSHPVNAPNLVGGEFFPISTLPASITLSDSSPQPSNLNTSNNHVSNLPQSNQHSTFHFPLNPTQPISYSPVSSLQPKDFMSNFKLDMTYHDRLLSLDHFHSDLRQMSPTRQTHQSHQTINLIEESWNQPDQNNPNQPDNQLSGLKSPPSSLFTPSSSLPLHTDKLLTHLEQHPRLNPFFALSVPICPLINPTHETRFSLAFPPFTNNEPVVSRVENDISRGVRFNSPFFNLTSNLIGSMVHYNPQVATKLTFENALISPNTLNAGLSYPTEHYVSAHSEYFYEPFAALFVQQTRIMQAIRQLQPNSTIHKDHISCWLNDNNRTSNATTMTEIASKKSSRSGEPEDGEFGSLDEFGELSMESLNFPTSEHSSTNSNPDHPDEPFQRNSQPSDESQSNLSNPNTPKDTNVNTTNDNLYPTTVTAPIRFQYFSLPASTPTFSHQSLWTAIKYVTYCLLVKQGGIAEASALTISGISRAQAEAIQNWLYPRLPEHNFNRNYKDHLPPQISPSIPLPSNDVVTNPPIESDYVNFLRNDDMLQLSETVIFYPKLPQLHQLRGTHPSEEEKQDMSHPSDDQVTQFQPLSSPLISPPSHLPSYSHLPHQSQQPKPSHQDLEPEFYLPLRPTLSTSHQTSIPDLATLPASINYIPKLFAQEVIDKINNHYKSVELLHKQTNYVRHHILQHITDRNRAHLVIDYLADLFGQTNANNQTKSLVTNLFLHYDHILQYSDQEKNANILSTAQSFDHERTRKSAHELLLHDLDLTIHPDNIPTIDPSTIPYNPSLAPLYKELQDHSEAKLSTLEDQFVAGIKDTVNLMSNQASIYTYDPYSSHSARSDQSLPDNATDEMDFDLSFNNNIGIVNSALIREYVSIDPRVQPLILLVKQWAKSTQLHGSTKQNLSSYAFTILALFYLQQIDILPNLQRYFAVVEDYARNTPDSPSGPTIYPIPTLDFDPMATTSADNSENANKPRDLFDFLTYLQNVRGQSPLQPSNQGPSSEPKSSINQHTVNTKSVQWVFQNNYNGFALSDDFIGYGCRHEHLRKLSLHDLFTGFLNYYSEFDFTKFVVSLSTGQPISKEYKNNYSWPSLHQHRLRGQGWNVEFKNDYGRESRANRNASSLTRYQSSKISNLKRQYSKAVALRQAKEESAPTGNGSSSLDEIDENNATTANISDDGRSTTTDDQEGKTEAVSLKPTVPPPQLHHHHPPGSRTVGDIAEGSESYSEDYSPDELTEGSGDESDQSLRSRRNGKSVKARKAQGNAEGDDEKTLLTHFLSTLPDSGHIDHLFESDSEISMRAEAIGRYYSDVQGSFTSLAQHTSLKLPHSLLSSTSAPISSAVYQHDLALLQSSHVFRNVATIQNDSFSDWIIPTLQVHNYVNSSPFSRHSNLTSPRILQLHFDQWLSREYTRDFNKRHRNEANSSPNSPRDGLLVSKFQLDQIQQTFNQEIQHALTPQTLNRFQSGRTSSRGRHFNNSDADGQRYYQSDLGLPNTLQLFASRLNRGLTPSQTQTRDYAIANDINKRQASIFATNDAKTNFKYTGYASNYHGNLTVLLNDLSYGKYHNPWGYLSIEDPVDQSHDLSRTCSSQFAINFTSQCEQSLQVYKSSRFVARLNKFKRDVNAAEKDIATIQHELVSQRNTMERTLRTEYTSLVKQMWKVQYDSSDDFCKYESRAIAKAKREGNGLINKAVQAGNGNESMLDVDDSDRCTAAERPGSLPTTSPNHDSSVSKLAPHEIDVTPTTTRSSPTSPIPPSTLSTSLSRVSTISPELDAAIHQHFTDHMHNVVQQSTAQFKLHDASYFSTLESYKPHHDHIQSIIPPQQSQNSSQTTTFPEPHHSSIDYRSTTPPVQRTQLEATVHQYPIPSVQKALLAVIQLGLSGTTDFTSNPMFHHRKRGKLGEAFYSTPFSIESQRKLNDAQQVKQPQAQQQNVLNPQRQQQQQQQRPERTSQRVVVPKGSKNNNNNNQTQQLDTKAAGVSMVARILQARKLLAGAGQDKQQGDKPDAEKQTILSESQLQQPPSLSSLPKLPKLTLNQRNPQQTQHSAQQQLQQPSSLSHRQTEHVANQFRFPDSEHEEILGLLLDLNDNASTPSEQPPNKKNSPLENPSHSDDFQFPPGTSGHHTTTHVRTEKVYDPVTVSVQNVTTVRTSKITQNEHGVRTTIIKDRTNSSRSLGSVVKDDAVDDDSDDDVIPNQDHDSTPSKSRRARRGNHRADLLWPQDLDQPHRNEKKEKFEAKSAKKSAKSPPPISAAYLLRLEGDPRLDEAPISLKQQLAQRAQNSAARYDAFQQQAEAILRSNTSTLTYEGIELGPVDGSTHISHEKGKKVVKVKKDTANAQKTDIEANQAMIQQLVDQLLREDASSPVKLFDLQAFDPVVKRAIQPQVKPSMSYNGQQASNYDPKSGSSRSHSSNEYQSRRRKK